MWRDTGGQLFVLEGLFGFFGREESAQHTNESAKTVRSPSHTEDSGSRVSAFRERITSHAAPHAGRIEPMVSSALTEL